MCHFFILPHYFNFLYTKIFTVFQNLISLGTWEQIPSMASTEVIEVKSAGEQLGRASRMMARLEKSALGQYAQRVATDYVSVFKDIGTGMRRRPLRPILVGAALFGLVYTCKNNPDEAALSARLAQLRQQMVLIPAAIHSTRADEQLEKYTTLLNGRCLELIDCWLFSLLVQRPFDKNSNFYAAQDKVTRSWPWTDLWENTMDVGAFGRFWLLENLFKNCDIREEEWPTNNDRV